MDWQADFIKFYIDDIQVWQTPTPADVNIPMFLIANLDVGDAYAGAVNPATLFPVAMQIDWIRAWQRDGVA